MPSFVMHIAIAKEYVKKHKDEIKNLEEFIEGSIAPDLTQNKNITHYGEWGNYKTNIILKDFLEDVNSDINNDYYKGYLLHLLSDDFTYNHALKKEFDFVKNDKAHNIIYDEFYYINKIIIPKYELVDFPKEIEKFTQIKDGKCKYLNIDKIIDMIEKMSSINLEEQIEYIRKYGNPKYNFKEV